MAHFKSASGNQIPIDPDRPQTKCCQRLTPYDGPVPSYIEAREEIAKCAGLSFKRLCGGADYNLVSVYVGTKDQITACELIASPERLHWPAGTRVPSSVDFIRCPPFGELCGNLHRISDDRFAIQIKENLPIESEQLPGGIERYHFKDSYSESEIFIGTKDQLVNGGFSDRLMFPDDATEEGRRTNWLRDEVHIGYHCFCVRKTSRLSGGKFALIRHLDHMASLREFKKREDEEQRDEVTSPEEWLERKEDWLCGFARALLSGSGGTGMQTETKNGFRYSITAAHAHDILQAIEVVAQRIRDLPVKVEMIMTDDSNEAARDRASAASTDARFQRFIDRAVGAPPNSAAGE